MANRWTPLDKKKIIWKNYVWRLCYRELIPTLIQLKRNFFSCVSQVGNLSPDSGNRPVWDSTKAITVLMASHMMSFLKIFTERTS